MTIRTISVLEHFTGWIKDEVFYKGMNIEKLDSKAIVNLFSKNLLRVAIIESLIDEDYKESKEAFDDRRKLWNSLVIEATKRDWCKSPQDAIEYANQVVEAIL